MTSYLCDLLCDVVSPVNELAGGYDVHLSRGQGDEGVRFEIHKVEGDLGDFGYRTVPHEVRVRSGVQYVRLAIYCACTEAHQVRIKASGGNFYKYVFFASAVNRMKKIKQINHILKQ